MRRPPRRLRPDMLFRRKNKEARPSRSQYRSDLTSGEAILATVMSPSGYQADGIVADLSIHGAGIQVPIEADPGLAIGDVVEVILRSPAGGWSVQTPIRVRQLRQHGPRDTLFGCEFINLGNLYSQLENALGTYFNRRGHVRVQPEVEHKVVAQIRAGARRVRSNVHDLSATGMGISVQRYQKEWIHEGQCVEVSFPLPDAKKELSGPAFVRHFEPLSKNLLVGLEFDLEAPKGIIRHMKKLEEYIESRTEALAQFAAQWASTAPGPQRTADGFPLPPPPPGDW